MGENFIRFGSVVVNDRVFYASFLLIYEFEFTFLLSLAIFEFSNFYVDQCNDSLACLKQVCDFLMQESARTRLTGE